MPHERPRTPSPVPGPTTHRLRLRQGLRRGKGQQRPSANDVHASRVYPHISVEEGYGGLRVSTKHPGDFQHGATDDQLTLHITNALSSALAYFNELDAQYPNAEPAAYNR